MFHHQPVLHQTQQQQQVPRQTQQQTLHQTQQTNTRPSFLNSLPPPRHRVTLVQSSSNSSSFFSSSSSLQSIPIRHVSPIRQQQQADETKQTTDTKQGGNNGGGGGKWNKVLCQLTTEEHQILVEDTCGSSCRQVHPVEVIKLSDDLVWCLTVSHATSRGNQQIFMIHLSRGTLRNKQTGQLQDMTSRLVRFASTLHEKLRSDFYKLVQEKDGNKKNNNKQDQCFVEASEEPLAVEASVAEEDDDEEEEDDDRMVDE